MRTMTTMTMTVTGLKSSGVLPHIEKIGKTISVIVDTMARKKRMAVKGLIKASASRLARDFCFSRVTLLEPYLSRFTDTVSSSSP